MADNKIDILFDLKVQENRVTRTLEENKRIMLEADRRTRKYKNAVKEVVKAESELATIRRQKINANRNLEKSEKSLIKTQQQAKNATGATTSAALELGRVIQDAPYGIRGMANNITQLVSQLGFAAKATGGWGSAIKGMISSLTGTLGVVFAISLVTSALDYFYGAAEKAEDKTSDLTSELEKQVEVLNGYKTALDSSNVSLEERAGIIKAASIQDPEFLKILKETGDAITEQEDALNGYIRRKNEELEIKKKVARLDSINKELIEEEANNIDDLRKRISELNEEKSLIFQTQETAGAIAYYDSRIRKNQELIDLHKERKKLLQDINKEVAKEEDERPEEGTAEYYKMHISNLEKIRAKTAKTRKEWDLQTTSIDVLKKKLKGLTGDLDKPDPKDRVDLLGLDMIDPKKEADRANKILKSVVKHIDKDLFTKEFGKELQVAPKLSFELSEETKAGIDAYNKLVRDMISDKFNAENIAEFADGIKTALSGINDFTDALFDRQLVTEQNKTNELNAELNNRLLNENLSAEKRKDIQNQIAQNDEKLRKKQNEIKKKAFNTNKAFQLSMAIADTASSVLKAYGSQLIVGDPSSIIRAKVAAGLAGAMGALQIATIATQKFQPDAATTPIRTSGGGGSGGVGNRSFDFNLVGNNQGNQVVDAIQSQFDKPIKAYVVSKDITNAQQLDANTKSSARFGG